MDATKYKCNKKKLIVSACLLGELCRYDGKSKYDPSFLEAIQGYELIPFCPEAPLFGTPRERISIISVEGENRIITDETKIDVTSRLKEEIASFISKNPNPDAIILKSKSPSCGLGTTPILDKNRRVLKYGDGIAASIMKEHYKEIIIQDELQIIS
jgi:uncharacterized protein YbbK (DUF523 family)